MTVLKQYNAGTSTWDAVTVGLQGAAGPVQPFLDFISQNWYSAPGIPIVQTNSWVVNRSYYTPIYLNKTVTFDRIGIATGGSFASSSATVRLGIYNSDSTGKPSTLILDAGTVSPSAANTNYAVTIAQTLSAGQYFLAANAQSITGSAAYMYAGISPTTNYSNFPLSSSTSALYTCGWFEDSVTGAFTTAGSVSLGTLIGQARLRVL